MVTSLAYRVIHRHRWVLEWEWLGLSRRRYHVCVVCGMTKREAFDARP